MRSVMMVVSLSAIWKCRIVVLILRLFRGAAGVVFAKKPACLAERAPAKLKQTAQQPTVATPVLTPVALAVKTVSKPVHPMDVPAKTD